MIILVQNGYTISLFKTAGPAKQQRIYIRYTYVPNMSGNKINFEKSRAYRRVYNKSMYLHHVMGDDL